MEFTSVADILKFAISKERASVRFFQDLGSKVQDPMTQSLMEVLTQKEQEHVAELEFEMEKLGCTVDSGENQNDTLFQWDEHLESDEGVHHMNFVEALLVAIQKERAAFRLYVQIMATLKDQELSAVIMELAEEEMRHVLQLEQQNEAIVHHEH